MQPLERINAVFDKYRICFGEPEQKPKEEAPPAEGTPSGKENEEPQPKGEEAQSGGDSGKANGQSKPAEKEKKPAQRKSSNSPPKKEGEKKKGSSPAATAAPAEDSGSAAAKAPREEYIPHCLLLRAFWDLQLNPVPSDLEQKLKDADPQGLGYLDRETFKSLYLILRRECAVNPQKAIAAFAAIDKNREGSIQKDEFKAALKVGGADPNLLTAVEFENFWRGLDADRNGWLCPAELAAALCHGVTAQELDDLLGAYGYELNGKMYAPSSNEQKTRPVSPAKPASSNSNGGRT
jgi:hypothetical protein